MCSGGKGMHFLKKASIKDLLQQSGRENPFRTKTDVMSHYKEFELYLSHGTLEEQWGKKYCQGEAFSETIEGITQTLQASLRKNNAVISAIHVPESFFKASGDPASQREFSSNYLSLCETIWDDASFNVLKFCIKLADEINFCQYSDKKEKKDPVILILHSGCVKGCCPGEESCRLTESGPEETSRLIEEFVKKLNAIELKTEVKIAVENITPYYDESAGLTGEKAGENCGWKCGEEQRCMCRFLKQINDKIASGEKAEESSGSKKKRNISFGLCVDVCHIFASYLLKNADSDSTSDKNKALCGAMDRYFEALRETGDIYLLHVSQYGEKGEHGTLFQYEKDAELTEKIRQLHRQYAPRAAITLEMTDGDDPEKACRYFDDMVYLFSAMHTMGEFAELLKEPGNEELKGFFDDLFWIYASDGKDSFELSQRAWRMKAYIVKHSRHEPEEDNPNPDTPFGFILDEQKERTALLRLKAYIYYTRFCNLGSFLAENYYSSFPFSEEHRTDDFRLAMNYFMFNDEMRQCVYTGVAYKFNIDFLPRTESFYRFNDGIKDEAVTAPNMNAHTDVFTQTAGMILHQINGSGQLYSVGKNFGQCLFKYYDPDRTDWTLRIYRDVPVNYIECKEGECKRRKYSIPAFLQVQKDLNLTGDIGFAIDISLFREGRNGLNGFFNQIAKQGIAAEKVASISDGEIVLTRLPVCTNEYTISLAESMLLKKAYFDARSYFREKKKDSSKKAAFQVLFSIDRNHAENAPLPARELSLIGEMEQIADSNQVAEIINHLPTDISKEEKSEAELSKLDSYGLNDCNELYCTVGKYIKIEKGGASDDT